MNNKINKQIDSPRNVLNNGVQKYSCHSEFISESHGKLKQVQLDRQINRIKQAFTMAEAVLVMTILGIIATVMITTIKPARFKEQGYKVLSKSVYASIDTAVTEILTDKAPFNKLDQVYKSGSNTAIFSMAEESNAIEFVNLLKDYMATARGDIPNVCNKTGYSSLLLKNGACISVVSGTTSEQIESWIPGEGSSTPIYLSYGNIFVDTNGDEEPNVLGTDQFNIPLNINGIEDGSSGEEEAPCENAGGIVGCKWGVRLLTKVYKDSTCTSKQNIDSCDECCSGYSAISTEIGYYSLASETCTYRTRNINICKK